MGDSARGGDLDAGGGMGEGSSGSRTFSGITLVPFLPPVSESTCDGPSEAGSVLPWNPQPCGEEGMGA